LTGYRVGVRRLAAMARSTAPNTGSDVANALFSRLDLYMVGLFLGEAPAGVYGVARQLRTPIRQIRQSLDTLLTPAAARTVEVDGPQGAGEALASASRFILALTLPVLILLFAMGEPLLAAFGPEFTAGYRAMLIVTAAELIQAAFGLSGLIFVYRQPWLGLQLTLIWMAVGAAAGCALIPMAGIEGAAASVLFAYAGMAFHRRLVLRRRFGVSIPIRHSLGPLVAALLAFAVSLSLRPLTGTLNPLAGASITAVAALAAYSAALFGWVRLTGERLSMRGFQHSGSAQQAA
jgi:O-antigen/teichoic acid export membrane protein